jgi:uncharacterized protein DUF2568
VATLVGVPDSAPAASTGPITWFALAVRFLLELAALGALGYAGMAVLGGFAGAAVAIGLVVVAATVWGLFVAPRARYLLPTPARLGIEAAVFLAATGGLIVAGAPVLAATLLGVYLLDRLVLWAAGAPAFASPPDRRR